MRYKIKGREKKGSKSREMSQSFIRRGVKRKLDEKGKQRSVRGKGKGKLSTAFRNL